MKINGGDHLKVIPPYAYILDEPNRLLIYDIATKVKVKAVKLPIKLKNCTSFLINHNEIYLTQKYSHHIICIGPDPYLS